MEERMRGVSGDSEGVKVLCTTVLYMCVCVISLWEGQPIE